MKRSYSHRVTQNRIHVLYDKTLINRFKILYLPLIKTMKPLFCKPRGFTLVMTLSLMMILSLLVVAMLSLSSVSMRSTARGEAMSLARANARFALMLALGELQKELGPDQRISAPGGQLLPIEDKSSGQQWVAVYEAWPAGKELRPDPMFRRWLISGDQSKTQNIETVREAAPAEDLVTLVADDTDSTAVEAGLIKTPAGRCAWWVGDQNMKAKLGGAVTPANESELAVARIQSSPRAAHEIFFNGDEIPIDSSLLDRLPTGATTALLGKSAVPLFHHATTTSLGLLTNVRDGGFRKDLSFLLETPLPRANSPEVAPLYTAGSTPGINLGELWVDHNIWSELENSSNSLTHADGNPMPSGTPVLATAEQKSDPFISYKHLPRLQLTLLYSLISKSRIANSQKVYDLYLVADPVFTIWNPFDVSLRVPPSAFATFKSWAIPYDLNLQFRQGPAGSKTSFSRSIKELSNDRLFFFYGQLGRAQSLIMRPGEVQVIAQGFGEKIKNPGKGVWQFDGKLGWEFASGYAYPIPYETNPTLMNGSQRIAYSMTPNTSKSDAGMFLWSYNLGELIDGSGKTNYVGSFNIDLLYSRMAGESAISPSSFPKIFPTLPLDLSASKTIAELEDNKWPICVFTYGLRTEADPMFSDKSNPSTRFTGRAMLRANETSVSQDLYNLSSDVVRVSPIQVGMRRVNSLNSPIIECNADGLGYYGAEYGAFGGVSHVMTRSIPRLPIHSLGALQHAAAEGTRFGQQRGERSWFLQPSVSHAISNSFAPSCFVPSDVRGFIAKRDAADHSYLANQALWDSYFYSSISSQTTSVYRNENIAYREKKQRLEKFLSLDQEIYQALPNERFRVWSSNREKLLNRIFPSNKPAPDAAEQTASFLMVDGMFNVNSTSESAWRSVLSGLKRNPVAVKRSPSSGKENEMIDSENTPVAALLLPGAGEIDPQELTDPAYRDQWKGFRGLDDEQIEELARAMVKQVRLRGPFLSLSDFVNRRPGKDKNLALSGALQSALDDDSVSINRAFRSNQRALSLSEAVAQGFPFPEAEAGAKSVCAPGYVKQADLLTSIGPWIHVRGDTFVIRAYGESLDSSGKNVIARAWCEAEVQRVPDYVDSTDLAHQAPATSPINRVFGRRFHMFSFRYLTQSEVS